MRLPYAWSDVYAGQGRWRWDLNPRKTCAFTRFRVLRTTVHHCPPASVTSTDWRPAVAGERPRTGMNETKTEPTGGKDVGWRGTARSRRDAVTVETSPGP